MRKLKKLMKNKIFQNILILSISIILALAFFITIIFITQSNKYNVYEISGEVFEDNKIIEINEIWINGSRQKIEYTQNEKTTFDTNKDVLVVDITDNNTLMYKVPKTYEFNIIFRKNSYSGTAIVKKNSEEFTKVNLNSEVEEDYCIITNDSSNKYIIMNYLENDLSAIHIIISIISIIIYYTLIKFILFFIKKVKYKDLNYKTILLYFISTIIIIYTTFFTLYEILNKLVLLALLIILILGLIYIKDGIKKKLENLFIYIMIPLGIIFSIIMLPGNIPDETSHFYKSYVYSTKILNKNIDKDNDYCFQNNLSISNALDEFNYDLHNSGFTIKNMAYYSKIDDSFENDFTEYNICYKNVSKLSIVAYLPTTLSLTISQILNIPTLTAFYLGRLTNLMFYLTVVYFAIKIIPKYKKTIFVIATLPIAIQSAIGFNQDCVHNALFILLFAYIIKMINTKDKISKKEIVITIILSLLLSLCKLGYFPLIFLIVLIPIKRFKDKKNNILTKLLMILPIIISFILMYFIVWNEDTVAGATNNYYSIVTFFKDPIDFIRLYLNTIKTSGFYMFIQGLVDGFAYSTKYNSNMITTIIVCCYTILLISGIKEEKNDKNYIIVTLFSALCIIGLILTSMLGQNPIGSPTIVGLQPRYFIPPILLIATTLNTKLLFFKEEHNKNLIYGILIVIIFSAIFVTILSGFYV